MSETFEPETGEMIVKRVSVPIGLEELMEGLAKEVLLKKPDDIYLFAADYFSRLLMLRDKGAYKVKTQRNAQSVMKQTPKQPIEKLLVRGASKQLSRQISIRGESPTKKVPPVKRPPLRIGREGKDTERNKYVERRKARRPEAVETKTTESKTKQVFATPRVIPDSNEDKGNLNKRDRSLSNTRRGRSSSRNAQATPRQKGVSTPRKPETPSENEKSGKTSRDDDKHKLIKDENIKEKPAVSQISSIEETQEFVKDGKLAVTPPKIIKPQTQNENSGKTSRGDDKHKLIKDENIKEKPAVSQISSIKETQEFVKDGKLAVTPPKIIKRPQVSDSQEIISSLVVPQVIDHVDSFTVNDSHNNNVDRKEKMCEEVDKESKEKKSNDQQKINDSEEKEALVTKNIADENLNVDNEQKVNDQDQYKIIADTEKKHQPHTKDEKILNGIEEETNQHNDIDETTINTRDKMPEKNVNNSFSVSEENKNKIIPSDTDDNGKDIKRNVEGSVTEEIKSDEVNNEMFLVKLKPEIVKSNESLENDGKAEKLTSDHKGTDQTMNLENVNHHENDEDNVSGDVEEANLELKTEETNLISELESNNISSETSKQKHAPDSETKYLKNDNDDKLQLKEDCSNQQNESSNKKGKEGNIATSSLEISDTKKEFEKITAEPVVHEITDNIKIKEEPKSANGISPETETQKDINIKNRNDNDISGLKKEYSNQLNESNNEKERTTSVTIKSFEENEIEHVERKTPESIISEIVDDSKIQGKFETNEEKNTHISEVDIKKDINSDTSPLKTENSNQQNKSIVNKEEGNVVLTGPDENKSETSDKGREAKEQENTHMSEVDDKKSESEASSLKKDYSNQQIGSIEKGNVALTLDENKSNKGNKFKEIKSADFVATDATDFTKIEQHLGKAHKINSDTEKCIEYKENNKVNEHPIDKVDHSSSTESPSLMNKEPIDKVAEKEKSNENKIDVTKNLDVTETKKINGQSENQKPISKDEGEDKKSDSTSEDLKTENEKSLISSMPLASKDQFEAQKPSENTTEEKEVENSSSLINDQINIPEKDSSRTEVLNETNNTKIINDVDNIKEKTDIENPIQEIIEDKLKRDNNFTEEKNKVSQDAERIKQIDMQIKDKYDLDNENLKPENQLGLEEHLTGKDKENDIEADKTEIHQPNISPLIESKSQRSENIKLRDNNILNISQKEQDSMKENSKIASENKDDLSTDSYSTSTDIGVTNKETTLSRTNTTDKDSNDTSKDEQSLQKSHSNSSDEEVDIKNTTNNDSIHVLEKNVTNYVSTHKSLENNSPSIEEKDSTNDTISSVISIAEGGLVDQRVKTYIGNFIQNEQQHVFTETSDIVSDSDTELGKQFDESMLKKKQSEDAMLKKHVGINETLDKQNKNGESSHGTKDKSIEHDLQLQDNETKIKNIINSTIDVVNNGLLDHQIKSYLSDFIQKENQHIFIENPNKILDGNLLTTVDQTTILKKEDKIENPLVVKSINDDVINSTKAVTQAEHVIDDIDKNKEKDKFENTSVADESPIINSTKAVTQTEHAIDDIAKKNINEFLHNEKKNVYILKDDIDTNKNIAEVIEKEIINDNESGSREHVKNSEKENDKLDKAIENETNKKDESTTEKGKGKTIKEDKKMRRIKTVDVIRDENKHKNQIKSRIPTADYRTRVKKDENGKHSLRMKRSSSHNDGVRLPVEDDTATDDKYVSIAYKDGVDLLTNDVNKCKGIKETKHEQEEASKSTTKPENKLANDTGKDQDESQVEKIDRQESLEDKGTYKMDNSLENVTSDFKNVCKDISLKEIVAAIKIQALWRGFKVRKNKAKLLKHQATYEVEKSDSKINTDQLTKNKVEKKICDRNSVDNKQAMESHSELDKQVHADSQLFATDSEGKSYVMDKSKQGTEDFDKQNELMLEKAAEVIQKIWRGFKVRNEKGLQTTIVKENEEMISNQTVSKSTTTNTDLKSEPEDQFNKAAVLIQKNWRVFRARKLEKGNIQSKNDGNITKEEPISRKPKEATTSNHNEIKTSQEIDLKQPQNEKKFVEAAILIQKIWRGFTVRKLFKNNSKPIIDSKKTNESLISINEKDFNHHVPKEELAKKQIVKVGTTSQEPTELKILLKSEEFIKAAVLIQKIWRGFRVRNQSMISFKLKNNEKINKEEPISGNIQEVTTTVDQNEIKVPQKTLPLREDEFAKAAILIQKLWRGFKIRKLFKNESKQQSDSKKETDSENLVNANYSEKNMLKEEAINTQIMEEDRKTQELTKLKSPLKFEDEFTKAAILIQKIWRGFKVRNLSKKNVESKIVKGRIREEMGSAKTEASIKVETKPPPETIQLEPPQSEDTFIKAAILIQKIWHGFKTRKQIKDSLKYKTGNKTVADLPLPAKEIDLTVNNEEITHSESITNSHKTTELKSLQKSEEEFAKAAILIQKVWKGFKVRNMLKAKSKLVNNEHVSKKENQASKNATITQVTKNEHDDEFIKAAILIQKVWRGFKVRNILNINSQNNKLEKTQLENIIPKEDVITKQIVTETSQKLEEKTKLENMIPKDIATKQEEIESNKSEVNKETTKSCDKSNIIHKTSATEFDEKFVRAAIMIQKIWRGFQVRKNRKTEEKKELFGKRIKHEKSEIETVKEIDPKDKKSATKIQSMWRGYQVRKNINVIKNKLEDTITSNDVGKGKELTDGDILNAATKIQAGVRGYLQRKKYKTDSGKLNSISEEAEKRISTPSEPAVKGHENDFNTNETKLSEGEVLKALEDLNKLKVPTDIPILHETDKLKFYRSDTEPRIEKKHNPLLLKSNTEDHTTLKESSTTNLSNTDNNNNANNYNKSSPLEINVPSSKHNLQKITNANETNSQQHSEDSTENSNVHQNFNYNTIKEDSTSRNKMKQDQILQIALLHDNKDTDIKFVTYDTGNQLKMSAINAKEKNLNQINTINKNAESKLVECDAASPIRTKLSYSQMLPPNLEDKILSYKDTSKDIKAESPIPDKEIDIISDQDEDKETTVEKNIYERPLSMDSNDSVVTVIYKDMPDKYNKSELEDNELNSNTLNNTDSKSNEGLSERETLIGDLQNKLLDQISGKNNSVEEAVGKFDIQQLRKELEEAGLVYNTDDNHIRHENSRELLDDHDQLLDYLEGFELSSQNENDSYLIDSKVNSPLRDLPDIKEEDIENKSTIIIDPHYVNKTILPEKTQKNIQENVQQSTVPNDIKIHKTVADNDLNVDKIKYTLKECEDIAREINMEFEAIKPDTIIVNQEADLKSTCTNNSPEKKVSVSNQSEQLFCGTKEKPNGQKVVPSNVELITPGNSKTKSILNVTPNGDQNKCHEDCSSQKDAEKSGPLNGLLHTGELHDSVVVPLLKESDSNTEDVPKNINIEQSTKNVSEINDSKLLHTGELHDTVVIPLPLTVENNSESEGKQLNNVTLTALEIPLSASSPSDSNSKVLHLMDDSNNLSTKGLLHTGEFHDTLVTPLVIDFKQSLTETHDKPVKTSQSALDESIQNPAPESSSSKQDQPTKLLHTGELHDSVVIPLSEKAPEIVVEDSVPPKVDTGEAENKPRQVDSECQTSGDPAIEVQLSDVPAGVEALTSPRPAPVDPDVSDVARRSAQARGKAALPSASSSDLSPPTDLQSMESEKRSNATDNNKSMEAEAATKIQAGFRGYQVRKQLKLKNGSSDINNQRRQLRRKSSGRLTETNRTPQNKPKESNEIEEKSAVKIQAGVRGFLVRRRQKKLKTQES